MIEWNLPHRHIGRTVRVYDRLDSTNTLAASLADDPEADGLAILAEEQSAGRGQHGRPWTAPPRSSVLLSIVLHPPPELRRPVLLTAWASVSVVAVAREFTGISCRIKWPNDVFLRERKVCGILIEQGAATVVGIGLNVTQSPEFFAAAGLPEATSLGQHGATATTEEVTRRLLRELDDRWTELVRGEFGPLENDWRWHFGLIGQRVRVECHDGDHVGQLLEIAFDGVALTEDGPLPRLLPCERIRHIHRAE